MSGPPDEVGTYTMVTTLAVDCCAGEEVSGPSDEVGTDEEITTLDLLNGAKLELSAPTKTKWLKRLWEITNQTPSKPIK